MKSNLCRGLAYSCIDPWVGTCLYSRQREASFAYTIRIRGCIFHFIAIKLVGSVSQAWNSISDRSKPRALLTHKFGHLKHKLAPLPRRSGIDNTHKWARTLFHDKHCPGHRVLKRRWWLVFSVAVWQPFPVQPTRSKLPQREGKERWPNWVSYRADPYWCFLNWQLKWLTSKLSCCLCTQTNEEV